MPYMLLQTIFGDLLDLTTRPHCSKVSRTAEPLLVQMLHRLVLEETTPVQ